LQMGISLVMEILRYIQNDTQGISASLFMEILRLRLAATLRMTYLLVPAQFKQSDKLKFTTLCHSERSEESSLQMGISLVMEILRYIQNDTQGISASLFMEILRLRLAATLRMTYLLVPAQFKQSDKLKFTTLCHSERM